MITLKKLIITTTLMAGSFATMTITSCATNATGATTASQKQVKPYPLKTCIVTDSKLGSMGDPVTKIYNGQEVKFCCAPCVKKFEANPEKYLAKIN